MYQKPHKKPLLLFLSALRSFYLLISFSFNRRRTNVSVSRARGRLIASFRRRSPFLDISGRRVRSMVGETMRGRETHLKGIRKVSKVKRAATRRCICEFSCRVRVFLKIVTAARVFIDASREEIHRTHIYIHVSYIHREHTTHTHTHVHMKIPLPIIATLSLLPLLLLLCYNWLLVELV